MTKHDDAVQGRCTMTCAGVRVLEKLMKNHMMTVYNDVCRG